MAGYTGPKTRIARKFQEAIYGPDKWMERKPHAPGQHGPNARRRKKDSEYSSQLREKQKAKYTYGILERQLEKMFHTAASKKGITGEVLLQLCEARLDNTVFRLGIAPTRRAARQLVSHGHLTVDGSLVNVASYTLRPGQTVAVRERSRSRASCTTVEGFARLLTTWTTNRDRMSKVFQAISSPSASKNSGKPSTASPSASQAAPPKATKR